MSSTVNRLALWFRQVIFQTKKELKKVDKSEGSQFVTSWKGKPEMNEWMQHLPSCVIHLPLRGQDPYCQKSIAHALPQRTHSSWKAIENSKTEPVRDILIFNYKQKSTPNFTIADLAFCHNQVSFRVYFVTKVTRFPWFWLTDLSERN